MSVSVDLERGRQSYQREAWLEAFTALSAADRQRPLEPEDLWRLATAALLTGRENDFCVLLDRAHRDHLERGERTRAARCAFWLGFRLAGRGEVGPASGWFSRARRILEREPEDCAEQGYLLLPVAHQQLAEGNPEAALATAAEARRLGERFGEPDLHTLALHLQGRALLELSRSEDGLALLDESMVAVAGGELSPPVTGLIYCSTIGTCRRVYALRRAHEWTAALKQWCDRQPEMVSYTGQCLVYRAEIMSLQGAWGEAIAEARRAGECGSRAADRAATASAFYQEGEVHRLRGDFDAAEEAFRRASESGRQPQPGLALLRLAQGKGEASMAAIRRVLGETTDRLHRARLLPAEVEIALSTGHVDEARDACEELQSIADDHQSSILGTIVAHARGAVELAAGDASTALVPLRKAWLEWQELGAPYESARARVLLALACEHLGDDDAARLERESAREIFRRLGALPDLAALESRDEAGRLPGTTPLTPRELEVLLLLATGTTNRVIAARLCISPKTVDRHVSNIFTKLGVSSRAAATAYAYEHHLV